MYTKQFPFKDYNDNPRNQSASFQLETRHLVLLLPELDAIVQWFNSNREGGPRILSTEEVQEFYTNFEKVLLEAWGEKSEDGLHFRRGGRYDFEESKLFAAIMNHFLTSPMDIGDFLDNVMPANMLEMIKTSGENAQKAIEAETDPAKKAELLALQARIAELQSDIPAVPSA